MRKPITVHVENFRSLRGRHDIEIAPVTLLVGENSTGKTALLAAAYASLVSAIPSPNRLEEEPFSLPAKETQLSVGASSMTLGSTRQLAGHEVSAMATYSGRSRFFWNPTDIALEVEDRCRFHIIQERPRRRQVKLEVEEDGQWRTIPAPPTFGETDPIMSITWWLRRSERMVPPHFRVSSFLGQTNLVYAVAPLRTKPLRIYSAHSVPMNPYGEHTPHLLNTVLKKRAKSSLSARDCLESFGRKSGLFQSLASKRLHTPAGEMFSLIAHSAIGAQTVQDVGYGVSQVLPIVAEVLFNQSCGLFLLQQPEVHLHPRAQVEVASFLVHNATECGKTFVVETHSDYIVDRVRAEVRNGVIAPDDVIVYYLSLGEEGTAITKILVDQEGNLVDVPDDFRKFFLKDQLVLLGLE